MDGANSKTVGRWVGSTVVALVVLLTAAIVLMLAAVAVTGATA